MKFKDYCLISTTYDDRYNYFESSYEDIYKKYISILHDYSTADSETKKAEASFKLTSLSISLMLKRGLQNE